MPPDLSILVGAAASLALVHTLLGIDHYVPFVALARAGKWSLRRALLVTLGCGGAHVLSSVVLGSLGIAAGSAVSRLEAVEAARGGLAAWALVAFGAAYGGWGLHRALRSRSLRAYDLPSVGELRRSLDSPELACTGDPHHTHEVTPEPNLTPWALFVVFALGPCEPLIPLLMYPAAVHSAFGVVVVATVFAIVTLGTMGAAVLLAYRGLDLVPIDLERFSHALAGAAILISGLGIFFLGW